MRRSEPSLARLAGRLVWTLLSLFLWDRRSLGNPGCINGDFTFDYEYEYEYEIECTSRIFQF